MSSLKRGLSPENNYYHCECDCSSRSKKKHFDSSDSDCDCIYFSGRKRQALDSSFTSEEMSDLGVNVLSDQDEPKLYNDHDARLAKEYEERKKMKLVPVGDFTYKKATARKAPDQDLFKSLPDEVVMEMLRFLGKDSLVVLSQTCRRFRRLCRDETLWKRLNLASRKLGTDDIGHILTLGVRVLRLNTINFPYPMLSKAMTVKLEGYVSKVRYLDLSYSSLKLEDLALLMSKMRHLRKLSLESAHLNVKVIAAVVENHNLDTLNLAMAIGLSVEGISLICKALLKLESLNLGWTKLSTPSFHVLCNNLNPSIRHLDISGAQLRLSNEDLISLFRRCRSLQTLDLSDCITLSVSTFRILIEKLHELRTLCISRCYQIDKSVLLEIGKMPKLEVLSAYRIISETDHEQFLLQLSNISINKSPFSVVARPTVGIRRSSIWEKATI